MKKIILTIVLAMLCLFFEADAQSQMSDIKPLKIGDTIPEAVWNMPLRVVNHSEGKKTITLNDYRGKLIILDFWATWCSPCIASLDKLAPIFKDYSDDMMLLPVASHNAPSIDYASKVMKEKNWGIPSVVDNDQHLYTKVFPPAVGRGIPHMVWIKDNKVIAIPKTGYATKENILKAISGNKLDIEMDTTNYFTLKYDRPLFVIGNGLTMLYYRNPPYSKIARYVPGYGSGTRTEVIIKKDTTIISTVNRRLQDILYDAWEHLIFQGLTAEKGIKWEISDSLRARLFNRPRYDKNHLLENDIVLENWIQQNSYGYQLIYPEKLRKEEAYYFMQQDLSNFFFTYMNLSFKIGKTTKHRYGIIKLLKNKEQTLSLLTTDGTPRKPNEKNGRISYYYQHYQQGLIAKVENVFPGLSIPTLIDSTGINPNLRIDYELPKELPKDAELINKELARYGLYVEVQEECVPVLVVTENKPAKNKI